MSISAPSRLSNAIAIVDLVDAFARGLGTQGDHPRPFGGLRYTIPARVAGAVRTAIDPPIVPVVVRNPSGYDLLFGPTYPTGSRIGRLAPGDYVLRVEGPYYQAAEIAITVPDLPGPSSEPPTTSLLPSYAYPFPDATTLLRGRFAATDGTGVAGVAVAVQGMANGPTYLTDATGEWALAFPEGTASGPVTITLTPPNGPAQNQAATIAAGAEAVLGATTLRGLAFDFNALPAAGASVAVAGLAPTSTVGPDGGFVYLFPTTQPAARVTLTVTARDGRVASVPNLSVVPQSTTIVPTIRFPRP
jgi:hypothetical protein